MFIYVVGLFLSPIKNPVQGFSRNRPFIMGKGGGLQNGRDGGGQVKFYPTNYRGVIIHQFY